MAWRNLSQQRSRTALSVLAVALGVAMTIAAEVTRRSIVNSLAGSEDAQTFMLGLIDQLGAMLEWVGVGVALAAGFLVFNAFAMSITQRQRQIGLLRSLGLSRRQTLGLVLVEALSVGAAGALLGLVAGPLLGGGTILLTRLISEGLFTFAASRPSVGGMLMAVGLGVGVTLLAVLLPAWRAARVSPLAALRGLRGARSEERGSGRNWQFASRPLPLAIRLALPPAIWLYLTIAPPGEWVQPPWDTVLTGGFVLLWLGCLGAMLPALIDGLGRAARGALARSTGAVGRLVADNLRRERGRVALTAATLALSLTMVVGLSGFIRFAWDELMLPKISGGVERGAWLVAPFRIEEGMAGYTGMERIALLPEDVAEIRAALEGTGQVVEMHYVIVPELSFLGSSYFSFVADPQLIRTGGTWLFDFTEGDWETAMPIIESGCGVLVTPLVAGNNGAGVGDTFTVSGADGPVECTVAGIGSPLVGASIIGIAAGDEFGISDPISAGAWPLLGVDQGEFDAALTDVVGRLDGVEASYIETLMTVQVEVMEMLPQMFNALMLLAALAAALGVINTTVMSVAERQRELGLLRAVGATRRQATAVVVGEAALLGLLSGVLGLVAGLGIVALIAVVYGGNGWGMPDLDLWPAAGRAVRAALPVGLAGVLIAPLISAAGAWLPARAALRCAVVESLRLEQ